MFAILGAVVCGAEIAAAKALGLDSSNHYFSRLRVWPFRTRSTEGGPGGILTSAVDNTYSDRIVRHEAGHRRAIGVPLWFTRTGLRPPLPARGARRRRLGRGGVQWRGRYGVLRSIELNAAARARRITRSVIDLCIVVMGGIAAEAVSYDSAEGPKDAHACGP